MNPTKKAITTDNRISASRVFDLFCSGVAMVIVSVAKKEVDDDETT